MPEGQRKLPPEPRLQGAPGPTGPSLLPLDDWRVYKEMTDKQVASYGWIDKSAGIARVPIERAKELAVERGMPMLSEKMAGEVERAESTRRIALGADSSGGRQLRAKALDTPSAAAAPAPVVSTAVTAPPAAQR